MLSHRVPAMSDRIRRRKNASTATTRTRRVRVRLERVLHYLQPAQVIHSPETLLQYRIDSL